MDLKDAMILSEQERAIVSFAYETRKSLNAAFGSSNSSKKRKREERSKQPCFTFVKTGSCKWGALCKFAHLTKEENKDAEALARQVESEIAQRPKQSDVINSGRSLLRSLQDERMLQQRRVEDDDALVSVTNNCDDVDGEQLEKTEGNVNEESSTVSAQPSTFIIPGQMSSTTYLERYFSRFYVPDAGSPPFSHTRGQDHYVYLQSNRICIIGICPTHPAVRPSTLRTNLSNTAIVTEGSSASEGLNPSPSPPSPSSSPVKIVRVEFSDFLKNATVSGKKKRGAIPVTPLSILATVHMSNGAKYPIRASIHAKVFELNTRLLTEPELLTSLPLTLGYIAIVQVQPLHVVREQKCLVSEATYAKLLECRGLAMTADGELEERAIP